MSRGAKCYVYQKGGELMYYKQKLYMFLKSLEVENAEKLMEKESPYLVAVGLRIARAARRGAKPMTDLDIAPAYRTQANLWKAKYFEMYQEVMKANRGIRRLRYKIDREENGENCEI
jgi:hypothetical protein